MEYRASNPLLEAFEELDKLNEASKIGASRQFWSAAKNSRLDTYAFHDAFDDELKELGLADIFDRDGMLTNQSVYGRIKTAKEANPDSWAIKALHKMWVMQFKDNIKSDSQIARERSEANAEAWRAHIAALADQRRRDEENQYKVAKEAWPVLEAKLSTIQDIVNTTVRDYAADKKATIKSILEKAVQLKADIVNATRGLVTTYNRSEEQNLASLNKETDLIKVSVTLPELSTRFPRAYISVEVEQFFGKRPYFRYYDKIVSNSISLTVDDLEDSTVVSAVTSLLDGIWEVVSLSLDTVADLQEKYDAIMNKVNAAKAAQAAVDAGRPVDPNFISTILDEFARGKASAKKAYDFYSDTTDGSAGAAEAMAIHDALVAIGTYLVNCNWRALVGGREIAAWRMTDSVDELEDALEVAFRAFSPDLMIEIIK